MREFPLFHLNQFWMRRNDALAHLGFATFVVVLSRGQLFSGSFSIHVDSAYCYASFRVIPQGCARASVAARLRQGCATVAAR